MPFSPTSIEHGGYPRGMVKRRRRKKRTELLPAIVSIITPPSDVVDFGAGNGRYVKALREKGYNARGVDAGEDVEKISKGLVVFGDLADPNFDQVWSSCDWGIFTEVGEHIPREVESLAIQNVCQCCRLGVFVTWGVPGQRGYHHVNCRLPEYVASRFAYMGKKLSEELTLKARSQVKNRFRKSFMVFVS